MCLYCLFGATPLTFYPHYTHRVAPSLLPCSRSSMLPPSHARLHTLHTCLCTYFSFFACTLIQRVFLHTLIFTPSLPPSPLPATLPSGQHETEWSEGVSTTHIKSSLHPHMRLSGKGPCRAVFLSPLLGAEGSRDSVSSLHPKGHQFFWNRTVRITSSPG